MHTSSQHSNTGKQAPLDYVRRHSHQPLVPDTFIHKDSGLHKETARRGRCQDKMMTKSHLATKVSIKPLFSVGSTPSVPLDFGWNSGPGDHGL